MRTFSSRRRIIKGWGIKDISIVIEKIKKISASWRIKIKNCKNSLACLIKKEIIRLTIVSTAAGVILFNQSLSLNPAGDGLLFDFNGQGLGGSSDEITETGLAETINYYIGLASKKAYVGFENAAISPDSEIGGQDSQTDDEALVIINNSAVFGSAGFYDDKNNTENRKTIITYKIKPGDTPSSIADYFNISTNTLLWANNLTIADATRIKIGDNLIILPVSGVRHIIKKNETFSSIAKKYSADAAKIMAFNGMKNGDSLEIDSVLIIPDGKIPVPPAPKRPRVTLSLQSYGKDDQDLANLDEINTTAGDIHPPAHGRRFPWGQCTYYVALRRYIPWSGNANTWLRNAKASGFKTGNTPAVGAIVATNENPRYGHVAYVEAVSDGKITISEMNFIGLGIKSVRVLSANSAIIKGYIYDAL